jgi:inosine/xanthosine triphosphate pyrophosphatase family protein/dephospho-CoA kinase
MGKRLGINVTGFREKHFYSSYHEPRVNDRETLLRESYESALEQWKKRTSADDLGFFILEDTSVRIDALSKGAEVPGVDVKYWMKGKTLPKLNRLINRSGGTRTATVRSDIVLHIPSKFRQALCLGDKLLWFHGETRGVIVESERRLEPNLLYPWLDNKTFNKWFVPDGFSDPISALSITNANTVDFRFRAFEQVAEFLKNIGSLQGINQPVQQQLSIPSIPHAPPIIVICGYSCAGKTLLSQWLRDQHGYMHFEASDFMYQEYWRRHGIGGEVKIGDFAKSALSQDPTIVPQSIAARIASRALSRVVVSGFRSPDEIAHLKQALPDRDVLLIFLEATQPLRFARAISRGRENVSQEGFRERDIAEEQMGLVKVREAGAIVLENTLTKEALYDQFNRQFGMLLAQPGYSDDVSSHEQARELENTILAALHQADRNTSYTTTEIARLVNARFGPAKSKNNISRYFNQDFHPYFEVAVEESKIKYRLSNTGHSEAIRLLRASNLHSSGRQAPRKPVIQADFFIA